jgi:hypothetical protein
VNVNNWDVELRHGREGWKKNIKMESLQDLKDTEFVHFMGDVSYKTTINVNDKDRKVLNLGKVWGVNQLLINGQPCDIKWFGNRIYDITDKLHQGENTIEVIVTTTMGNYMKTLTDNPTAQKYTMRKNREQPIVSMGLVGPVTLY